MIARATTCVGLSLSIACAAAVALHRPDLQFQSAISPAPVEASLSRDEEVAPRLPTPTPVVAWEEPTFSPVSPPRDQTLTRNPPRMNRADVVKVLEGETLEALTARVYGQSVDLDALWNVNRDQLATRETPLKPGMLLRTPDLVRSSQ